MFTSALLPQVAARLPAALALKQGREIVRYGDLHDRASRLARVFRDRGVGAGDRIALLGHPCIDLVIAEHAAIAVGAIPFAVYCTLAQREIQQIIDDAAPSVVVFQAAFAPLAAALRYTNRPVEIAGDGDAGSGGGLSVARLIERARPVASWHESSPGDLAMIVYTGGTSGRPKGVVHTYGSISSWASMNHPAGPGYAPGQRSIVFNLAHMSGQANLWKTVAAGGELMLLPSYPPTAEGVVDLIERERVSNFGAAGGLLSDLVHLPGVDQRDLRSLRVVAAGGTFISPRVLRRAVDLLSPATILFAYGLTESGHAVSASAINDVVQSGRFDRLRSVGMPGAALFGQRPFSIRIVDDAGQEVRPGEDGEIVLHGDQMMAGYWNDVDATQRVLRDGWLWTGDVGHIDGDGYLYLVDRKKDIIIAHNGVNVYTSEVEEVVGRHPSVAEVAVIRTRAQDDAEEITAVVALRRGTTLTLPDLLEFCATQIASFKMPSRLVVVEALPRTVVGKIAKVTLQETYASAGGSLGRDRSRSMLSS